MPWTRGAPMLADEHRGACRPTCDRAEQQEPTARPAGQRAVPQIVLQRQDPTFDVVGQ